MGIPVLRLPRLGGQDGQTFARGLVALTVLGTLAGCASPRFAAPVVTPSATLPARGGGYYENDGPGAHPPPDLAAIPNPTPRLEPLDAAANRPYTVFGQTYVPMTHLAPYDAVGVASWYGRKFQGVRMSCGEPYDMYAMTAAHRTLPIPSFARVTNLANHRSVIVRITDRGPFMDNRLIDLSYTAAYKLGLIGPGSGLVEVQSILPDEENGTWLAAAPKTPPNTTPDPAPPALQGSIVASAGRAVYLQLGAFSARQDARDFRDKARLALGELPGHVAIATGRRLFRVNLGPFKDRQEASRIAAKVQSLLQESPLVIAR
ncbi:MAG: septal ring lytic transglycosylase RlpA family protein [Betaproteobacteria bacterium]|nr:septal ring lytic transglycosylase RlpA family protein [Betaproteobacteria bacterium]